MKLCTLLRIGKVNIMATEDGDYVQFLSDLDVCNDGTGPSHGDPYYIPATAYYNGAKYLNADVDKYIVIPPQLKKMLKKKVMGCKAQLTNTETGVWHSAVVGEVGPKSKTGEASYALAKIVCPKVTHNSGDTSIHYLYEIWPGVPAIVEGKHYHLEPVH